MPRAARASLLALAALAIALALLLLGNALTRREVRLQGDAAWTTWQRGDSPWQWPLRSPRDVVAGRLFGAGHLQAGHAALQLHFIGGDAQLGLPLAHAAALTAAPLLRLHWRDASQSLPLTLLLRPQLDAPACTAAAGVLPAGSGVRTLDLTRLPWNSEGHAAAMPARAAMLRLQFDGASGTRITLLRVSLHPAPGTRVLAMQTLAAWQRHTRSADAIAVVGLPAWFSSRLLAERDALWRADPAAVALPQGSAPQRSSPQSERHVLDWLTIAVCALLMLAVLVLPQARWPRVARIAKAVAALLPVLLIAFGIGDSQQPDARSWALILLALGYAALLTLRRDPALRSWRWLDDARGWALQGAPALLAGTLWLLLGQRAPALADLLRYLPWALLQQFLLLVLVARRLDAALPRAVAVLASATLFALGHTPNSALMLLAFAAGLWWSAWFLRRGALLPVVLAHALAGTLLQAIASNEGWLRSLAIGARYLGVH